MLQKAVLQENVLYRNLWWAWFDLQSIIYQPSRLPPPLSLTLPIPPSLSFPFSLPSFPPNLPTPLSKAAESPSDALLRCTQHSLYPMFSANSWVPAFTSPADVRMGTPARVAPVPWRHLFLLLWTHSFCPVSLCPNSWDGASNWSQARGLPRPGSQVHS